MIGEHAERIHRIVVLTTCIRGFRSCGGGGGGKGGGRGGVLHLVEGAEMVGGELGEGRGGAGQGGGLLRGEVPQELGRGSAEELREGTARACAEMF